MENSKTFLIIVILIFITICYGLFIYTAIINFERSQFTYNETVFEKHDGKKIVVAFRNDDLSINSNVDHEKSVLNIFRQYGVKQTFAYIPKQGEDEPVGSNSLNDKSPILEALEDWYRQNKIEFAVHGYTHKKSEGSNGEFDGLLYVTQLEKIADGKRIIDKTFYTHVNIFAPPWNQADSNTIKACLNAGIHIFSGYLGKLPAAGMTFVNTNAVLFPKANPMGEGTGLPSIEHVLAYARNGTGTTFIIAFYHSRYDFKKPQDYSYLIRLLKNITSDPSIEVSSIGEIAQKYKDFLPAYNQAGLNIAQALRSQHRAKPYVLLYRKFQHTIGEDFGIDLLYGDALHAYWSGNYKQASALAHEIIDRCDNYIISGRIIAILSSGAVFLLFLVVVKFKKPKAPFSYYRNFLLISVAPFLVAGGFLNIFRPVSNIRIDESNIVSGLYIGGILIQYLLLKLLDTKRKT